MLVNICRKRREHSILIFRGQYKERSLQKNKNKTTLIQKKKKSTKIENLKAKPQQEDPFSALAEEEEPRRWSPWQDPWLYQAKGWHQA